MTDYISREMTIDAICRLCNANFEEDPCEPSECEMMSLLREIPAADVRPVVRGKWKRVVDFTGVEAFGFKETMVVGWGCNVCGYEVDVSEESFSFCPNCGAKMEES